MTSRFYSIFRWMGNRLSFLFAGNFLLRDKIHSLFILRSVLFSCFTKAATVFSCLLSPSVFLIGLFSAMGERGEPCYNMGMMKEPKS